MRKLAAAAITTALAALTVITAAPADGDAINMNGAPAPAAAINMNSAPALAAAINMNGAPAAITA